MMKKKKGYMGRIIREERGFGVFSCIYTLSWTPTLVQWSVANNLALLSKQ